MSYHIFPNKGKLVQGYMVSKTIQDLASKVFLDKECNFNVTKKVNGRCVYGGECCGCCVIYKFTCKFCGDFYIGNTQNTLKRVEQHFQDVAQNVVNNKNPDSSVAHFAKHFTQKPSPQQCRKIISFNILSTVKPIASMKTWCK